MGQGSSDTWARAGCVAANSKATSIFDFIAGFLLESQARLATAKAPRAGSERRDLMTELRTGGSRGPHSVRVDLCPKCSRRKRANPSFSVTNPIGHRGHGGCKRIVSNADTFETG